MNQRCVLCNWYRYDMCCRSNGCIYENSNSEIEKSKSEIVPDYRDGWRLKEGDEK